MVERFDDFEKLQDFEQNNNILVLNIFETQEEIRYEMGEYHYMQYWFILYYIEKKIEGMVCPCNPCPVPELKAEINRLKEAKNDKR